MATETAKDLNYYGVLSTGALRKVRPSAKFNMIFLSTLATAKGAGEKLALAKSVDESIGEAHEEMVKQWQAEVASKKPKLDKHVAKVAASLDDWLVNTDGVLDLLSQLDAAATEGTKINQVKKRRLEADVQQERKAKMDAKLDELIDMVREEASDAEIQSQKKAIINML